MYIYACAILGSVLYCISISMHSSNLLAVWEYCTLIIRDNGYTLDICVYRQLCMYLI